MAIVRNADPSKEVVALGQAYFAVQTRIQEIQQLARPICRHIETDINLCVRKNVYRFPERIRHIGPSDPQGSFGGSAFGSETDLDLHLVGCTIHGDPREVHEHLKPQNFAIEMLRCFGVFCCNV